MTQEVHKNVKKTHTEETGKPMQRSIQTVAMKLHQIKGLIRATLKLTMGFVGVFWASSGMTIEAVFMEHFGLTHPSGIFHISYFYCV